MNVEAGLQNPALSAPPTIRGWRVVGVAAGIAAATYLAAQADWSKARLLLNHMGAWAPLVVLPFLLAMCLGTIAWRLCLIQLGRRLPLSALLRVRIMAEMVMTVVPGGAVITETLKPVWLRRRFGVELGDGAASVVLTKALILQTAGAYWLLALLLAYPRWASAGVSIAGPLRWVWQGLPALALVMCGLGWLLMRTLKTGSAMKLLHSLFRRVPIPPLQRALAKQDHLMAATHGSFVRFFGDGANAVWLWGFVFTLGQWFAEAVETFLILRLLGVHISPTDALLVESLLSTVRALVFFLPGGLGAQEVAAFFLFQLVGVSNAEASTTAWAFTKRSKEVFWIVTAIGLGLVKRR